VLRKRALEVIANLCELEQKQVWMVRELDILSPLLRYLFHANLGPERGAAMNALHALSEHGIGHFSIVFFFLIFWFFF